MKNKLLTTALLVILPFFITACTLSDLPVIGKYLANLSIGGKSNKQVTLNVWGLWENPEVMDIIKKKYEETHPNVKINYDDRSVMNPNDYRDTVLTRISQKDAPDAVLMHNSWVYRAKDALSPMPSNLMDVNKYNSTFYPVAAQSAVLDNKIYAVPVYYDGLVLVYNKKHFTEVGQASAPTAWEEFRRLAASLTIRKGTGSQEVISRAGAAIGTADNIDFSTDILGMMFAQAGVNVPKEMDSKAAQDALVFYTNFAKQDKVWDNTFQEASAAFAGEKVSMIFVPSWNLLDILVSRPDLDIGVAPVPQATPTDPVSWGSFWMYGVPASSANKEAAWDFINFMTSEEQQLSVFSEASKYRTYGAPYSISTMAPQLSSNPYLKPLLDTAPFAKSSEFAARSGNTLYVDALKGAINSVLGINEPGNQPKDASVALKAAKDKINSGK